MNVAHGAALVFGLLVCWAASTARGAITWPSDSAWNPLRIGTDFFWDPLVDEHPATTDTVGSRIADPVVDPDGYPAAYWLYTNNGTVSTADDQLLFRIRVLEIPTYGTNAVWTFLINTDTDNTDIECGLQLDLNNDDRVELMSAASGGSTFSDVDLDAGNVLWSNEDTSETAQDYSRLVEAGQVFGSGTTNGFVDFGIPWDAFAAATGVTLTTPLSFIPTTSTTHELIQKDIPLDMGPKDPISGAMSNPTPAVVPEPASVILLAPILAGLGFVARWRRRRATAPAA